MNAYEKSIEVLTELFSKDCTFSLATVKGDMPAVRVVDAYYHKSMFWIVTYATTNKVKEVTANPKVALCNNLYSFKGKAFNVGHPLDKDNQEIREKLIEVFKPWYFAHNDENDENMCFVKVELEYGFFYKNGKGYKVNFIDKNAEEFPFTE
ncbi:pyridoxamine 5-phosphate oxidase [Sporanaerobium hydrogeniformans]|uniref:Pyridoxamine 5-phosphate oxidase n=1 Tax=Sporanaerobium hydrogeniformans TaxID=3072179 RepID=A0AC61DJK3_9FIRM|nr:pyridoxamine 5'-phosphate oxidase family protein [Sporanaerobium hydrogeniformans]PHV72077.1 pyridoxamine 5-phosphate oxidase [Sporanaerobium hydrogeniformans]